MQDQEETNRLELQGPSLLHGDFLWLQRGAGGGGVCVGGTL